MTKAHFDSEINRLKREFGQRSVGPEKANAYWRLFYDVPDEVFTDAISMCFAELRGAPAASVLQKFIVEAKRAYDERGSYPSGLSQVTDFLSSIPISEPDPEAKKRIKARIKLLQDYNAKKISKKQWREGMAFYDSFLPPAERPPEWPYGTTQASNCTTSKAAGCSKCQDSGLVHKKDSKGCGFVWRCTCRASGAHNQQIPQFGGYQ